MNKSIALSALTAIKTVVHGEYLELPVWIHDSQMTAYYRSQDWSETWTDENGWRINVPNNNSVLLKSYPYEGDDYAWKPYIRGGAI
jgi:hypothetical protein